MPTLCPECSKEFKSNNTVGKCDTCGYMIENVELKKQAIQMFKKLIEMKYEVQYNNKVLQILVDRLIFVFPDISFHQVCADFNDDSDYESD